MNIKQLIIAGILSIGMPVIVFAAECPDDLCADVANATSSNAGNSTSKDRLKQGQLILTPVTATAKADSNTDIPTYTVPKK